MGFCATTKHMMYFSKDASLYFGSAIHSIAHCAIAVTLETTSSTVQIFGKIDCVPPRWKRKNKCCAAWMAGTSLMLTLMVL